MIDKKKNLKVATLSMISLFCILGYFLLENSAIIPEIVEISEKGRYGGFPTFFISGLFKYGLIVIGMGIIIIMGFLLVKKRINKPDK